MTAPKREPVVYEAWAVTNTDGSLYGHDGMVYLTDEHKQAIAMSMEDGERPVRVRVTVEVVDCAPCGTCMGEGQVENEELWLVPCPTCGGTGQRK